MQDLQKKNNVDIQEYNSILRSIKCMVCQGQSIEESNTIFAKNIKKIIYEKMEQNETKKDITNFLQDRYGEEISLEPNLSKTTLSLWACPIIFILIGVLFLQNIFRRHR